MAFTANLYGALPGHLAAGRINWASDTIKLALCTSAYTPNQDTHDFFDDVTNQLSNGNGYTTGGFTLASKTANYDAGTNTLVLDAADISASSTTLTWRVAVLYDDTPATAATKPLIAYFVSDTDIVSTGGTTTITFAATGIARITVS